MILVVERFTVGRKTSAGEREQWDHSPQNINDWFECRRQRFRKLQVKPGAVQNDARYWIVDFGVVTAHLIGPERRDKTTRRVCEEYHLAVFLGYVLHRLCDFREIVGHVPGVVPALTSLP